MFEIASPETVRHYLIDLQSRITGAVAALDGVDLWGCAALHGAIDAVCPGDLGWAALVGNRYVQQGRVGAHLHVAGLACG